jgi:aldose 1-epimerase
VTLNVDSLDALKDQALNPKYGATCGRTAGRIAAAQFKTPDGKVYQLEANNGPNNLHGGSNGFSQRIWQPRTITSKDSLDVKNKTIQALLKDKDFSGIVLTRVSADMEEGFPGKLFVEATYCVTADNELFMSWYAEIAESKDLVYTPINLCNHAYWNLSGDFKSPTIAEHYLRLQASHHLDLGEDQIPRSIKKAEGPFDLRVLSKICDKERLTGSVGGGDHAGIDHPFCVNEEGNFGPAMRLVAELHDKSSGRQMKVSTTQPAVVVYTSNYLPRVEEMTESDLGGKH